MLLVIVVVIHIVVVAATPLRFFKFFAALARLSAVLAVALHRVTQLIISLVGALAQARADRLRGPARGEGHLASTGAMMKTPGI